MKLLLDTGAYSALLRGNRDVADRVRRSDMVLMSAVVLGELRAGFLQGSRAAENSERLDVFLRSEFVRTVPVGMATAHRYGRIVAQLRRDGRPIPTNDVWIAAHNVETGAILLSNDAHFEAVAGLFVDGFEVS